MAALMLGETLIGWRAFDAFRALDYLQTRPEVDGERLGAMGISGGGLTTLFAAALDARIKAAVVSGYLCTFADSILAVDHCPDNYAPGLLNLCEMPDITALIAPRALFAESGKDDMIFPQAGVQKAFTAVQDAYAEAGVPERFASDVFDGGHIFSGEKAWPFLAAQL
jgi:dienelactone hydrolase